MDNLSALALPLILLVGIVFISVVSATEHRKLDKAWRSFAEENKLQFTPSNGTDSLKVTGTYCGRTLHLVLDKRLSTLPMRPEMEIYTQATVSIANPKSITLTCSYPGALFIVDSFAKQLKYSGPIRTGDQHFDSLYTFKGTPVEIIARLIQSARLRSALLRLKPTLFNSHRVQIKESTLIFERDEIFRSAKQLKQLVDDACDIAGLFEEEFFLLYDG